MTQATRERIVRARKKYAPIPEVFVPFLAGVGVMIATWIGTGEFSRLEGAQLFTTGWSALIGYMVHRGRATLEA